MMKSVSATQTRCETVESTSKCIYGYFCSDLNCNLLHPGQTTIPKFYHPIPLYVKQEFVSSNAPPTWHDVQPTWQAPSTTCRPNFDTWHVPAPPTGSRPDSKYVPVPL